MAKLAATDGYRIRRIGTRPRNTKTNTPTAAEWKVLQGLTAENPVFQGPIDGREVYMQAQFIPSPLCLTCHGNGDQIPKEVTEALAKLYPDDQATGYALGDLRGALIVERTR
jgi:hypothetical protein